MDEKESVLQKAKLRVFQAEQTAQKRQECSRNWQKAYDYSLGLWEKINVKFKFKNTHYHFL